MSIWIIMMLLGHAMIISKAYREWRNLPLLKYLKRNTKVNEYSEYFRINLIQFNPHNPVKKWKIKYEPPNNITGLFHFNNSYYLLFFYLTIFSPSLICVFNTSYAIIHPSSLYVNIFLFSYSFYNIVCYFHCFSVYFS